MAGHRVDGWRRLAALAAGVIVLASPAAALGAGKPGIDRDFSVVEKFRSGSYKNGVTTLRNDLFRAGTRIGSDRLLCRTPGKVTRCEFLYRLPKGHITGRGDIGAGSGASRITGGTGAYAGASGSLQGRKLRKNTALVTFHLDK